MNNISLQQIEIFLTVAEQLNLSEAAKDLFINQSAVSRWIQRLETSLGTTLFVRNNRGVDLTEHGEFLYTELKPLYEKLTEITQNISKVYITEENILRIGCMDSSEVVGALKPVIRRFEKIYPDTLIKIDLLSFKDLREALVCGKLDFIAVYSLGFGKYWNIQEKNIKKLNTYIAVSSKSPLADSIDVPVESLNKETLFLLYAAEMRDAENRALENCRKIGFMPKEIVYMPNFFSLELAIKNGKGFAISGANIRERFGSDIKLYHVPKPYHDQYVIAAWQKNRCSAQIKKLTELIDDIG
ncbi:MAG: LysR family transcriptional regulator [Clostridiales bacterium]|nr:LysR family transcriptional regulator [Clostridiales bacterium]